MMKSAFALDLEERAVRPYVWRKETQWFRIYRTWKIRSI